MAWHENVSTFREGLSDDQNGDWTSYECAASKGSQKTQHLVQQMMQKSAREEVRSPVRVLGDGGDMAQGTAPAHMGSTPLAQCRPWPRAIFPRRTEVQSTKGFPVSPSGTREEGVLTCSPCAWGKALSQQGKELGEDVSRMCGLRDDEKEGKL